MDIREAATRPEADKETLAPAPQCPPTSRFHSLSMGIPQKVNPVQPEVPMHWELATAYGYSAGVSCTNGEALACLCLNPP